MEIKHLKAIGVEILENNNKSHKNKGIYERKKLNLMK